MTTLTLHCVKQPSPPCLFALLLVIASCSVAQSDPPEVQANRWRERGAIIDLHMHLWMRKTALDRAVAVMDASGLGVGVNLSGGTVTRKSEGQPSAFERNVEFADRLHPGRFVHYMNIAWPASDGGWEWDEELRSQIDAGYAQGAAGLKISKRVGLYLRGPDGKAIPVDSPKLDAMWRRCGELGMPVSIHVADPKAFWDPYDSSNERWTELKDHKSWWFGDAKKYPPRNEILDARNRVIARHAKTTFVCVHFANNPEDLDAVDRWLDRYPNMMVDLAARVPEIGRHDPDKLRRFFIKHQDRILFATDFMSVGKFILGSGGDADRPTVEDANVFYAKHWRFLETRDRDFAHMTPIQGEWTIDGIGLPADVLQKIYFDNARKLLGPKLPPPTFRAAYRADDFELRADHDAWRRASRIPLARQSRSGKAAKFRLTHADVLWSKNWFYVRFTCPYSKLTTFGGDVDGERIGLWDKDVVEAFIGTDTKHPRRYKEFELAPDGEHLDLTLDLPKKDFKWNSEFEVKVEVGDGVWHGMMRIPMRALSDSTPKIGDRWRINLYRCDRANRLFLATSPTLTGTFHRPWRFALLELAGED